MPILNLTTKKNTLFLFYIIKIECFFQLFGEVPDHKNVVIFTI